MAAAPTRKHLIAATIVATLGIGFSEAAGAQEYCVACSGPDATYRCVIDQAVPTGMPLKMLCISTLAKQGGHAACSVRGGTVFDCVGAIKRIDAKAAGQALATPPAPTVAPEQVGPVPAPGPVGVQPSPVQPANTPNGAPATVPPKTVEELAKRVTKSSGDSLDKAGSAISKTTAKAWTCLTSLFKTC